MLAEGKPGGIVAAARQQAVHGIRGAELGGCVADDLGIGRLADGEVDLGGVQVGAAPAQACLGLRGISGRDVAGIEALLGDAERFLQECHVGALRVDQRLVGEHVGIDGDGVEQHALADIAQGFAAGLHLQFRYAHAVGGLETVEQRLGHGHADGPGFQVRRLDGVVGQQVAHRLKAGGQSSDDLRPITRKRLRHILVGGPLARPFGIEMGIGLVGLGQRLGEVFAMRGRRRKRKASRRKANARSKQPPFNVANPSGTPSHLTP